MVADDTHVKRYLAACLRAEQEENALLRQESSRAQHSLATNEAVGVAEEGYQATIHPLPLSAGLAGAD